ncbi:MAG TPA: LON peptidase substrate-binding domain-containing protein, partial [Metalysinibacillus sp.]
MTTKLMPILPLRGLLVYPKMRLHIDVGRERSIAALEEAMEQDKHIFLVTQKDVKVDSPTEKDLYDVGTIAYIKQLIKLPNGTLRVLVEGVNRATFTHYEEARKFTQATVTILASEIEEDIETAALQRIANDYFARFAKSSNKITSETVALVEEEKDASKLADLMMTHLPLKIADKQEVLAIANVKKRLDYLIIRMHDELEVIAVEKKISARVKDAVEKTQKEYYLREQLKAIQDELGSSEGKTGEVAELKKR